jgi:hypothetical protein
VRRRWIADRDACCDLFLQLFFLPDPAVVVAKSSVAGAARAAIFSRSRRQWASASNAKPRNTGLPLVVLGSFAAQRATIQQAGAGEFRWMVTYTRQHQKSAHGNFRPVADSAFYEVYSYINYNANGSCTFKYPEIVEAIRHAAHSDLSHKPY